MYTMIKKLTITLFILLIILTIAITAIPKAMQFGAIYLLDEEGVQAEIDDINIEIFNGVFEVIGAQGVNEEGNGFNIGYLLIDFDWPSLSDHSITINSIKLDNFKLDTVHGKQSILSVGGINLADNNTQQSTAPIEDTGGQESTPWNIALNNIALNDINVCNTFESKKICSKLESFNWIGEIKFNTGSPIEENINIQSTLSINNISITDMKNSKPILINGSIDLNTLTLDGIDKLAFESFTVNGFKIFPEQDTNLSIAAFDSLAINKLKLTNNKSLYIKNITLTGTAANIIIDKEKSLNIQQSIAGSLPIEENNSSPKKDTSTTDKKPLQVKIDEVRIEDGNLLTFIDKSLNTPFENSYSIKKLIITNLDTQNLQTRNHLKADLAIGQHGKIIFEGDIQLLSDTKEFNISGDVKGVDLRPVSSYLEPSIGHKIKSGQLNAGIKLSALDGSIDSLLDLNLKKFKLRPISEKEKAKLNKELGLGMPLDAALNLLRDGDDNINIELPITGDVNNPDFDPSDAIYTAMSKAITATIINYYTPFGLVTVAGGLFDLATALRFEPIVFNANKSSIISLHEASLDKVVQLMKQRPKLHLTLCGFSNMEDLSIVSPDLYTESKEKPAKAPLIDKVLPELTALASKRSENIKMYFVNHKIAADRLILCEPEYKQDGISGVELSL